MDSKQTEDRSGGLTQSHVDAIAGVVIFLVGVVMMVDNYKLGAGWVAEGPAAGYFPFRIGAIICAASAFIGNRARAGVIGESFCATRIPCLPPRKPATSSA